MSKGLRQEHAWHNQTLLVLASPGHVVSYKIHGADKPGTLQCDAFAFPVLNQSLVRLYHTTMFELTCG